MTAFLIDGSIVAEHDRRMYLKTCNAAGTAINLHSLFKGKKPADCFVMVGQIKGRKLVAHKGDGHITCWWCGRTLENSLSRIRGVGPICIGEYGPMPGRDEIEDKLAHLYEFYRSKCKAAKQRPLGIKNWLKSLQDDEFSKYWLHLVEELDPSRLAPSVRSAPRPAAPAVQAHLGDMTVHPELVEVA